MRTLHFGHAAKAHITSFYKGLSENCQSELTPVQNRHTQNIYQNHVVYVQHIN